MRRSVIAVVSSLILVALAAALPTAAHARPDPVRFATFNASLNRNFEGQLVADLSTPGNAQAQAVWDILRSTLGPR